MKKLMKSGLALALAAAMVFSFSSGAMAEELDEEPAETESEFEATDWMANVPDDMFLSSVTIPGTHDSATAYIFPSFFLQCQSLGFKDQLEFGYRYLDIRVALDETEDGTKLKFIHNFGTCKTEKSFLNLFGDTLYLEDVLSDVYAFLDEHPTETVIFCVKAENGDDDVSKVESEFFKVLDQNASKWYTKNEIPTLGDVRGKIVLATRFKDVNKEGENRTGLHFSWSEQNNKEAVADTQEVTMITDTNQLWVQDRYKYGVDMKWDAVVESFENCQASDETFSLNFLSTSGSGKAGHPKKYARILNKQLMEYQFKPQTCYGVVIVDFGKEKEARHIFSANFK